MDNDERKDEVLCNIRSVLVSNKGKSDLRTLQNDYRMLMGEPIPYRNFGFTSLESFLKSFPTLSVTVTAHGQVFVDAVKTENVAHLVDLVNRQKTSKKKINYRSNPRHQKSQRRPSVQNWKPVATDSWGKYQPSQRLTTVSHNQIINVIPNNQPSTSRMAQSSTSVNRSVSNYPSTSRFPSTSYDPSTSRVPSTSYDPSKPYLLVSPSAAKSNMPPLVDNSSMSNRQLPTYNQSASHKPNRQTHASNAPTKKAHGSTYVKPKAIQSPRSRAAMHIQLDDNLKQSLFADEPSASAGPVDLSPMLAVEKGITSRSARPSSTNGFGGPIIENIGRPRMRIQTNLPPMPQPMASPMTPSPVVFSTPPIPYYQLEKLTQDALNAVDTTNAIWNFSSGSESSPNKNTEPSLPSTSVAPKTIQMDALSELKDFLTSHNLDEPSLKTNARWDKKLRKNLYDAKISVGNSSYLSYPQDCDSPEMAKRVAAQVALEELRKKYSKEQPLIISTAQDILERLPDKIAKHAHGIFSEQVELDYIDEYGEGLPTNWLSLLDTLRSIVVEPYQDKKILKNCKIGEKHKQGENPNVPELSIPSNTVRISKDGCRVLVTYAASTVEIWCRQLDTEEGILYEKMSERMTNYYNQNAKLATSIAIGGNYVVKADAVWCRVRAIQQNAEEVLCFFIDYGDEVTVSKTEVYSLSREYAKEQAQAFVCRLAGLEELANLEVSNFHLMKLLSKDFWAKPLELDATDLGVHQCFPVVLYADNEFDEASVNELLITEIIQDSENAHIMPGKINKVYVTNAEDTGDIFVQVDSEGCDKLHDLMEDYNTKDIEQEFPDQCILVPSKEELYLTRWQTDNKLYRCIIEELSPKKDYVLIFFVDYGNSEIIRVLDNKLIPLKQVSSVLNMYPHQAIKVRMDLEPVPPTFKTRVLNIMPPEQLVFLKVLRTSDDNVPICEFFKRSEADNLLFNVNSSLILENQLRFTDDRNNNDDRAAKLNEKLQRIQIGDLVPSHGCLKAPIIPKVGNCFDVRVSSATTPWNFCVQPYQSIAQFQKLMEQIQEHYNNACYSPVQNDEVIPGKIYISKYHDGQWYRTSVIKVIHPGSVSVFLADVGNYSNLTVNQLLPILPEFMEFPYQAIKAKIAGIDYKLRWTFSDCTYFRDLVNQKTFVSKIESIQKDELYASDSVICLRLIDTSQPDNDIYIDQLLMEKGIAISKKAVK